MKEHTKQTTESKKETAETTNAPLTPATPDENKEDKSNDENKNNPNETDTSILQPSSPQAMTESEVMCALLRRFVREEMTLIEKERINSQEQALESRPEKNTPHESTESKKSDTDTLVQAKPKPKKEGKKAKKSKKRSFFEKILQEPKDNNPEPERNPTKKPVVLRYIDKWLDPTKKLWKRLLCRLYDDICESFWKFFAYEIAIIATTFTVLSYLYLIPMIMKSNT